MASEPDVKSAMEAAKVWELVRAGKLEEALALDQRRRDAKLNPHPRSMACLIEACAKAGDFPTADALVSEAIKTKVRLPRDGALALIAEHASRGMSAAALETLTRLLRAGYLSISGLTAATMLLCSAGLASEAAQLARTALDVSGSHPHPGACAAVLTALCKTDKAAEALELLNLLSARGAKPTMPMYNTVISGFCRANNIEAALRIVALLTEAGNHADVYTFTTLIGWFCRAGDIERALGLVELMKTSGVPPTAVTYNQIAVATSKAGDFAGAVVVIENMIASGVDATPSTFKQLLETCPSSVMAERLFEAAVRSIAGRPKSEETAAAPSTAIETPQDGKAAVVPGEGEGKAAVIPGEGKGKAAGDSHAEKPPPRKHTVSISPTGAPLKHVGLRDAMLHSAPPVRPVVRSITITF
jgi:pentatricopeptide repeat protein